QVNGQQIENLRQLANAANGIDCDATSLAAYHRADSLLVLAATAPDVYQSDTYIHAALTEIFYGMSYSRALYAVESTRGEEEAYLMEYLDEVVEHPIASARDSLEPLAIQEINALYAILNFFLLADPEVYAELIEGYAQYHYAASAVCYMDSISEEQSYRLLKLNTRNAYFQVMSPLVVDTYAAIFEYDDSKIDECVQKVLDLGHRLDVIPGTASEIIALPDTAFWRYNTLSADVCARLTGMLASNVLGIRAAEIDYRRPGQKLYLQMDEEE
ncbi:MAG: hypothetical protein J6Z12_06730, partial [Paludibacteraceae bacterium]|nr:hypothetical protein [Paludibacteraceae bacterium]